MSQNREIKAGIGYTIGNILIKGISFLTLPIFSRLMATQDYGYFNTYVAYEAIVSIFLGVGMHASIKNALYDFKNELDTYMSTQAIIVFFTTILGCIIYSIFHLQINLFTGFTSLMSVCLILQSFGTAMLNILNAKLALSYNYATYLKFAAFNTIANVLISIILILTVMADNRLLGRVIGAAIPLFAIGISTLYMIWRNKPRLFNKKMARYALSYGAPLVGHFLSQQIQSQFDRIMITKLVDAASTGIYSFVYTIANIFQILFYSADNVWSVWFFKEMAEKKYFNIREKAKYYMLIVAIISCLMMMASREIIMVMGATAYWEGINLFVPIIVGMFFLFMYTIPVGIEYYYKETKYIGETTAIAAIVNIMTNYIFIMLCGYKAAAYTTAFSYIIMFFLHWHISKKILKKHGVSPFFRLNEFGFYTGIVILAGILVTILNPYPIMKYIFAIFLLGGLSFKYHKVILEFAKELLRNK